MITWAMIYETLDVLQREREIAGIRARRYYRVWDTGFDGAESSELISTLQEEQRRLTALSMSWHDVIRGCRTESEFRARVHVDMDATPDVTGSFVL